MQVGVFNKEEVQLTIYDADHNLLSAEQRILVYPDTVIVINEEVDLPPETNFIALEAYDADNTYVGMLDEIDFTPGAALDLQSGTTEQKLFTVKNTVLRKYDMLLYRVNITTKSSVVINIIDPAGRVAEKVFNGVMPTGAYDRQYQIKKLKAGIYFVVFSGNGNQLCYKIIMTN
jgi:hypothetical protein